MRGATDGVTGGHRQESATRRLTRPEPGGSALALPWSLPISFPLHYAPVAQLDRVLPSEGRGHRFESCRARQFKAYRLVRCKDGRDACLVVRYAGSHRGPRGNYREKEFATLVVTHRTGESIVIEVPTAELIEVTVVPIKGNQVT
jgi:hypothetical protein